MSNTRELALGKYKRLTGLMMLIIAAGLTAIIVTSIQEIVAYLDYLKEKGLEFDLLNFIKGTDVGLRWVLLGVLCSVISILWQFIKSGNGNVFGNIVASFLLAPVLAVLGALLCFIKGFQFLITGIANRGSYSGSSSSSHSTHKKSPKYGDANYVVPDNDIVPLVRNKISGKTKFFQEPYVTAEAKISSVGASGHTLNIGVEIISLDISTYGASESTIQSETKEVQENALNWAMDEAQNYFNTINTASDWSADASIKRVANPNVH